MLRGLTTGAVIAAAALAAMPTAAQMGMIRADRPESVAAVLRGDGHDVLLDEDDTGDPLIESERSGLLFSVIFDGCTRNQDCKTLKFYAGFGRKGVTPATIARWNAGHRFVRARLDEERDPVIEMEVEPGKSGMSKAAFREKLAEWIATVEDFKKHIDF